MRNPLSAIVHCADDIIACFEERKINQSDDVASQRFLDALAENAAAARIIETCATHQKYIIDSVLTLGRLESDMLSFTPSPARPSKIVEGVLVMFDAELRANNISARALEHASIKRHGIGEVNTDASRVTQIFINLVSNAIKFVKTEATREIEVQYGACVTSPRSFFPEEVLWAPSSQVEDISQNHDWGQGEQVYLTFSIRDTGIGIAADEMSKIFERFTQANVKTHVRYGGSGLGLFISKQLTQKQGGEIGVWSTVGKGSTFVFYLRVRRVLQQLTAKPTKKRPALVRAMSIPAVSFESPDPLVEKLGTALYVLLVEDNVINQQVLRKQLTRAGCVVYVANHGADALEKLRNLSCWYEASTGNSIDVILMDVQMPVMDGLACTRHIRNFEAEGKITRHVPIIAVTANVREEQVAEALAAGAVSHSLTYC
jgi:CheY-like chemotaxis protein